MWPSSWKKVNQNALRSLKRSCNWITGISLYQRAMPWIGADLKFCAYKTLMPSVAPSSCNLCKTICNKYRRRKWLERCWKRRCYNVNFEKDDCRRFFRQAVYKKLQKRQKSRHSFQQRQPFAEWKIDVEGIKYYHINFFSKIYWHSEFSSLYFSAQMYIFNSAQ